jgi:hypothetical protein
LERVTLLEKGPIIGCVLASPKGIGWSLACKKDLFDRDVALNTAFARSIHGTNKPTPHTIKPYWEKMLERVTSYFKPQLPAANPPAAIPETT